MSAKDKESKPLEKLKQFFRGAKTNQANYKGHCKDFILSQEVEREIGPTSPVQQRIKTIKELNETVLTTRLEDYGVEKLWNLIKDLFNKEVDTEHRHVALNFLKCLAQGQYEKLGLMRVYFFQLIKKDDVPEDTGPLFELLQVLTQNGRDIHQLEDEFSRFLASWVPAVAGAGKVVAFLDLLVNFIKCNSAYVDESDVLKVVEFSCFICCWSQDRLAVQNGLNVLGAVVCYSELPGEALPDIVAALCRKVNEREFTRSCWKITRDLFGTHMGHSTLFTICKFLQSPAHHNDKSLLRGAVFYVSMGLWSDKRVPTLKCTPMSILPSLLQALECRHSLVFYEVIYSVQRLVSKHSLELQYPAWDVVLDILKANAKYLETDEAVAAASDDFVSRISTRLHDTLTVMEQLIEVGQFNGSQQRVFELIEMTSRVRPESSVLRLIAYHATSFKPTKHEWLTRLDGLVDKYFKQETRPNIRIKVVDVVSHVLSKFRYMYEEELVERIILNYFNHIEMEEQLCVRKAVAQLLLSLCAESESKKCVDVLDILEKILNRPYDLNLTSLASERDILDVKTVAEGLINIFHTKLHQLPSGHAIKTYRILVGHMEHHYQNPNIIDFQHDVHFKIIEMLLKLRVNKFGQAGLLLAAGPKFSPYFSVESTTPPSSSSGSAPPSPAPTTLSLASASKVIIAALNHEKDWRILNLVLTELPIVMQNTALVADRYGADVGQLADALCSMLDRPKTMSLPESLKYVPPKLAKHEFQSSVFPAIAALSAYHQYMDPSTQVRCIMCLEYGLASKCASQCVISLTICALEMRDVMYKVLPEVLIAVSKISATVYTAIPILEFLSTLTSLPTIFASFVGDQYMSVFAIAMPYTNPFKFNHYTVSLAHHVIAVWFLKCRLPFRRDFVKFITTGLIANALVPFEEGQMMVSDLAPLNEDSTSRKRSSSLTEQGSRRRERPLQKASPLGSNLRPPLDDALMNFHVELTETCIDLMARYTFSSCEAKPARSAAAEFLLNGGQSQTWLLGHKLITVTTSGCTQKPLKNNLCDRCWMLCRLDRDLMSPEVDSERDEKRKPANENQEAVTVADETKRGREPKLEKLIFGNSTEEAKTNRDVCACWCQRWAEIHVRRPTGDMSWVMRLQNETHYSNSADVPFSDLSSLYLTPQPLPKSAATTSAANSEEATEEPSSNNPQSSGILSISTSSFQPPASHPVSIPGSPTSRNSSRESVDEELDHPTDLDPISANKSRNPVRRSNSSPEMSANWKNPFLKDKLDDSQKARVSCEAIPEEMTPPEAPVLWKPPPSGGRRRENLKLEVGLTDEAIGRIVREKPRATVELDGASAVPPTGFIRDRSRTISVMSPVRKSRYELDLSKTKAHAARNKEAPKSGVCPSFVFLQLYHSTHFGASEERPILISNNPVIQRAIFALDFIPPFETHKVGVIYIGPGQAGNEAEILRNEFGSVRYAMFLQSLGTLINLKDADPQSTFLGGLDKTGVDGQFAYIWQDDVTQVTFHVATLMPNKESDPNCNAKKLHIGNDYVTIVYNESGEDCNYLKGQFNYANVVIQPLDLGCNKVTVQVRDELEQLIAHDQMKIVSNENLPILARQLALHANLASEVSRSLKNKNRTEPYASNWLERLRKIKRLRKKVLELDVEDPEPPHMRGKKPEQIDDFTDYT